MKPEPLFGEEIIMGYTTEQAIEDGMLVHPYPERWPWLLITASVHDIVSSQDGRSYDQCLVPLLMDCIMAAQANKRKQPPIKLSHTVCGDIWIMPNEKGGMTVMLPRDY